MVAEQLDLMFGHHFLNTFTVGDVAKRCEEPNPWRVRESLERLAAQGRIKRMPDGRYQHSGR